MQVKPTPTRSFWNIEVRKTDHVRNEFRGFGTERSYGEAVRRAKQHAEKYPEDDIRIIETVGVVWRNY